MTTREMIAATGLLIAFGLGDAASGQTGITASAPNKSPLPPQQQQLQLPPKGKAGRGNHATLQNSGNAAANNKRNASRNRNQIQSQANANSNADAAGNNQVRPPKYADALRKYRHERHDRVWWKQRYTVIVLVSGGYYYWEAGYWCPAWGYDPNYEYYDYDGPIYTYGNLLPDQVIANVQRTLKQLGYYAGEVTGSLGATSRQALANYQSDAGLDVTGAIDAATVEALGLVG